MRRLLLGFFMAIPPVPAPGNAIDTRHLVCTGAGTADQVAVEIANGEGRVRMPAIMVPKINGGNDGWFALKNIKADHDDITASVELSPAFSAEMRLHRVTGALNLAGNSGSYNGACRPSDPATRR